MGQIGLMTDVGGGTIGLPVLSEVNDNQARDVVLGNGANINARSLRHWTDAELNGVMMARIIDVTGPIPEGSIRSDGFSDMMSVNGDKVERTYEFTAKSLDRLKQERKKDVAALYSSVVNGGIIFSLGAKPLGSSLADIDEVVLTITRIDDGKPLPAGYKWTTLTGARITTNETQLRLYRDELAEHYYFARKQRDLHQDAIDAFTAGQEAQLIAYDITVGWPANPDLS